MKTKITTLVTMLASCNLLFAVTSKDPIAGALTLIKNYVIPLALIFCVYGLVRSGLKLNNAEDDQAEKLAKKSLKNNIIGIAVIASAFFIVNNIVLPIFSSGVTVG